MAVRSRGAYLVYAVAGGVLACVVFAFLVLAEGVRDVSVRAWLTVFGGRYIMGALAAFAACRAV